MNQTITNSTIQNDTLKAALPVIQQSLGEGYIQTIDARSIHQWLEIGRDFSNWIKDRIEKYGFEEGHDYVRQVVDYKDANSGEVQAARIEYHLTLDMAKEIAMVERNARGKEARRYFIECERRLHQGSMQLGNDHLKTEFEAAEWLASKFGLTGNQALLSASNAVEKLNGVNPMKLMGVSGLEIEDKTQHFSPTELSAQLEMKSAQAFNQLLERAGIQRRVGKRWVPTSTGQPYAVTLDTNKRHGNGAPVTQLRWKETVLQALADYL